VIIDVDVQARSRGAPHSADPLDRSVVFSLDEKKTAIRYATAARVLLQTPRRMRHCGST